MKNPLTTFYDLLMVVKILSLEWAAPEIQKVRRKLGLNPYTKLDYRMRFGNHILPSPLTNYHCFCCGKFTLRRYAGKGFDNTPREYFWAGMKWNYPTKYYECVECFELGELHRAEYLKA